MTRIDAKVAHRYWQVYARRWVAEPADTEVQTMLSRDEQAERIIAAWIEHGADADTTATELAEIALTALECGEPHPDRASVRCTQLPHGNGHLYHRNTEIGLEWWTNDDAATSTVHDVLGPITLVQRPVRADVEILVPFISGEGPAETQVDEPRGRYHTLPPCEDDPEPDDTVAVADRAVYRGLLPVLGEVSTFLNQMGQRYREGNPRMNAATCRTAEVHRDALNFVTDNLRELLAVDGD